MPSWIEGGEVPGTSEPLPLRPHLMPMYLHTSTLQHRRQGSQVGVHVALTITEGVSGQAWPRIRAGHGNSNCFRAGMLGQPGRQKQWANADEPPFVLSFGLAPSLSRFCRIALDFVVAAAEPVQRDHPSEGRA